MRPRRGLGPLPHRLFARTEPTRDDPFVPPPGVGDIEQRQLKGGPTALDYLDALRSIRGHEQVRAGANWLLWCDGPQYLAERKWALHVSAASSKVGLAMPVADAPLLAEHIVTMDLALDRMRRATHEATST